MEGIRTPIRLQSDTKNLLDIIGRLHRLSEHVAQGDSKQASEVAVEIPTVCMFADKSLLLKVSASAGVCLPLAYRGMSCVSSLSFKSLLEDQTIRNILRSQSPYIIDDINKLDGCLKDILEEEHAESVVCVPTVMGSMSVILIVIFHRSHSLTIWEMEALCTITNQIVTVVNRDQSRTKSRKGIDKEHILYFSQLYKMARSITSTLDFRAILSMIRKQLTSLVHADVCAMILYEGDAHRPRLVHGWGIPSVDDEPYINLILTTLGISSTSNKRLLIPNLSNHLAVAHCKEISQLGLSSAMVVPLEIKHRVIGYVAAFSKERSTFSNLSARLMLGFTQLASIAIDNARLYERQSDIAAIARRDLLPRHLSSVPGFDIGHKYTPANQVGGDYYDLIKLNERKIGIVMSDVSGRDVSAATYISMCKHSIRALAPHISSPAALLREMNRLIYSSTEPEAFISMFYAVLDTSENTLTYASAGHEPALLMRFFTGHTEFLHTHGILLGVIRDATFGETQTSIDVGDVLLLYTDGLVDSLATSTDYGTVTLERMLSSALLKPAVEIADNIHRVAFQNRAQRVQDDMALLAIKRL